MRGRGTGGGGWPWGMEEEAGQGAGACRYDLRLSDPLSSALDGYLKRFPVLTLFFIFPLS